MKSITITTQMTQDAITEAARKRKCFGGVCAHCGKMVTGSGVEIAYVNADGDFVADTNATPVVIGSGCRKVVRAAIAQ